MRFLRYAAYMAFALPVTFSFAQGMQEVTSANNAAIVRMLRSLHTEELAMQGIKQGFDILKKKDPQGEAFLHELMDSIKPGQIIEKFVPIYSKYYSSENALATARFFESPTGIKISDAMLRELAAGKRVTLETANLSPSEQSSLMMFMQSPAGRLMAQSQAKIREETGPLSRAWGQELVQTKMKQAFAPVVKEYEAELSGEAGVLPPAIDTSGAPKGISAALDQIAAIIIGSARRSQEIKKRYNAESLQLGLETLLSNQNLVSQAGIVDGRRKIQRMSDDLDQFLQSSDDVRKTLSERLNSIALPPSFKESFMKGVENSQAVTYDESIRFGENQRTLIELYQRTLDFAEARLGKLTIRDDVLVFSETADLEIFRTLIAQIKAESEREKAILQESQERLKQSMQNMTAQKNAPAPATKSFDRLSSSDLVYSRVSSKLKSNINFEVPVDLKGNEPAEYSITLFPDGMVRDIKLIKSSGLPAFDDAVRKSIEKSQPYPPLPDRGGNGPPSFLYRARPKS